LRKRMAAARSEAWVEAAARSDVEVKAVVCFDTGVEVVAYSEAEEAAACSRPRIEDGWWRWHIGV
jgi:hypothetical protein